MITKTDKALSVAQVNNYVKASLENDFVLQDIWIEENLAMLDFMLKEINSTLIYPMENLLLIVLFIHNL